MSSQTSGRVSRGWRPGCVTLHVVAAALIALLWWAAGSYPTWGDSGPGWVWLSGFLGGGVVGLAVMWRSIFSRNRANVDAPWLILAYAVVGMVAAVNLFEVPNGALDFRSPTQRSYLVADSQDVGEPGCGDEGSADPEYRLRARDPDVPEGQEEIVVGVTCDDTGGLPVDGGEAVPVGREVVVDVKPGFFDTPWRAGWRAGTDGGRMKKVVVALTETNHLERQQRPVLGDHLRRTRGGSGLLGRSGVVQEKKGLVSWCDSS